jgi:ParB/RepB/Spo0J family partition protein
MLQLISKPVSWFRLDPNQVRKLFDDDDLRRLGESLREKQLQPVVCAKDGAVIAGERRVRAAILVGLATLEAKIIDEPLSQLQVKLWQLTENIQRSDLSGYEKWLACTELMCMNPSWQMKDLAAQLHLDASTITRLLSPSKCIEAAQTALKDGKIGISDCYPISKLPEKDQAGLLALKLSGASRDAIERAGRKARNGGRQTVKVARIRHVVSAGKVLIVSGPQMSLEEYIDLLQQAIDAARKANRESLDVKTAEKVWKTRAKA